MIYVCDAIMGSGKSFSATALMNSHPEKKFIYISPYKADGPIIQERCKRLHFAVPANLQHYRGSKTDHCRDLIKAGRNIACTHELFKRYDHEILDDIRQQQYTIIIDEEVTVMKECEVHPGDIDVLMEAGYITDDGNGNICKTEKAYRGKAFADFFQILKNRNLYKCGNDGDEKYYYWQLPPDLISSFSDAYILTYLFDCQDIRYMLDMHGMKYQRIYIKRTEGGGYEFSDVPSYLPEYVSHISDMIDIYEGDNLNAVGRPASGNRCPLSMNWFKSGEHEQEISSLKDNLYSYFRRYDGGSDAEERLWGSYVDAEPLIKGKGYSNSFLVFNTKGSNEYRHKKSLAYCVNLYVSPQVKNYYAKYGITPDEDQRALSIMIQWIWRSAIRDGQPIHIYVPSERMRNLLKDWMAKVEADARSGRWMQHDQQLEIAS